MGGPSSRDVGLELGLGAEYTDRLVSGVATTEADELTDEVAARGALARASR